MSRVSGVTELVRVMILRGDFGYGGHLVEFQIAERLGVRGTTLRDALDRVWDRIVLAAAHLIGASRLAPGAGEHREILAAVTAGDEAAATALAHRHAVAAIA